MLLRNSLGVTTPFRHLVRREVSFEFRRSCGSQVLPSFWPNFESSSPDDPSELRVEIREHTKLGENKLSRLVAQRIPEFIQSVSISEGILRLPQRARTKQALHSASGHASTTFALSSSET